MSAARILVADDDEHIQEIISDVLSYAGFDVALASDGDEAIRLTASYEPDLLILDITMPGANGYDVCREVQAQGVTAPPVIFLTGYSDPERRVRGLDLGAVDYVSKPFDANELVARVRAALRTKALRDALLRDATTDGLTGLANRRQLEARADEAIALARRHGRPLACLMIDVDWFKRVNDTYGHEAGDMTLREVGRRIASVSRTSDVAARYGGEEFAVLMPETTLEGAVAYAERVRLAVGAAPIALPANGAGVSVSRTPSGDVVPRPPVHPPPGAERESRSDRPSIGVTVSVGVAAWDGSMDAPQDLFAAADGALYRAKEQGRNRVEVASASRPEPGSSAGVA
jgi:diguanylate cyclase (GGDEF)-like protein